MTEKARLQQLQRTYAIGSGAAVSPAKSAAEAQLDRSMKEFAEYVKNLQSTAGQDGQEDLSEEAIKQLFTSNVYTQTLPTEPLRMVELERVPPGLQRARTIVRPPDTIPWDRVQTSKRGQRDKAQYGVWYLPPSQWQLSSPKTQEPLVRENPAMKQRAESLKEELSHLQGARLFRDFLAQQNAHVPTFLEGVGPTQRSRGESARQRSAPPR